MNVNLKDLKKRYDLSGKRVAIIATHGFEQSELDVPFDVLEECGAGVEILAPELGAIRGWESKAWGKERWVTQLLRDASAGAFHALHLPGGVLNSDHIRMDANAVRLTREFFDSGKPVSAICHAGQLLIEADVVRGRRMTSYRSIRKDLENAGAEWVDEEVVVDRGLTTSRAPDDLPAFCEKMCEELLEGPH